MPPPSHREIGCGGIAANLFARHDGEAQLLRKETGEARKAQKLWNK